MANKRERNFEEEAVLLLHQSKRGLFRLVFGRTGLIFLLLLIQIGLLILAFARIGEYYYGSAALASLIGSLLVINKPGDPTTKITWILLIFLVPVLGIPLYCFVNADLGHRLVRRRLAEIRWESARYLPDSCCDREKLARTAPGLAALADYVERWGGHGIYGDSDVRYFPLGELVFEEMLEQLEQAEKFIFLEYFIVEEGYMWGRILNILERKVREGVEVRVMYDGTCVVNKLPYSYCKSLRALGIQCRMYAPPRPFVSTHYNNRDHRKIMVIDGRVAFTGGVNLADEYINRTSPYGHWKDTAVMVTGRAVAGFTRMFLQMWNVQSRKQESYTPYLEASGPVEGEGFVLPYGDSPLDSDRVGHQVYLDIINRARRYVHIMTPYLILDAQMEKMNDGVLVIVGDVDEEYLKQQLLAYVGNFRTKDAPARKTTVRYQPVSGWTTYTVKGWDDAVDVALSARMPLTFNNYLAACIAVMAIERDLTETLARAGMSFEVLFNCRIYPEERMNMIVSVYGADAEGFASGMTGKSAIDALAPVREALSGLASKEITDDQLKQYKAFLKNQLSVEMNDPQYWVDAIVVRYLDGKDLTTGYAANIDALSKDDVKRVLALIDRGCKVEYVTEN